MNKPVITYNSTLTDCLLNVFQIISWINENPQDVITLDLSEVRYAYPSFVMPLITYLLPVRNKLNLILSDTLHDILFPEGLSVDGMRTLLLKSRLNECLIKDYLPIITFPSKAL